MLLGAPPPPPPSVSVINIPPGRQDTVLLYGCNKNNDCLGTFFVHFLFNESMSCFMTLYSIKLVVQDFTTGFALQYAVKLRYLSYTFSIMYSSQNYRIKVFS
jgi:hypothetical protein